MTPTSTADYQRTDGRTLRLTFSEPEGALRGGLVVLHEADGVTDGVKLLLASLATEGWLTVTSFGASGLAVAPRTDCTAAVWLVTERT